MWCRVLCFQTFLLVAIRKKWWTDRSGLKKTKVPRDCLQKKKKNFPTPDHGQDLLCTLDWGQETSADMTVLLTVACFILLMPITGLGWWVQQIFFFFLLIPLPLGPRTFAWHWTLSTSKRCIWRNSYVSSVVSLSFVLFSVDSRWTGGRLDCSTHSPPNGYGSLVNYLFADNELALFVVCPLMEISVWDRPREAQPGLGQWISATLSLIPPMGWVWSASFFGRQKTREHVHCLISFLELIVFLGQGQEDHRISREEMNRSHSFAAAAWGSNIWVLCGASLCERLFGFCYRKFRNKMNVSYLIILKPEFGNMSKCFHTRAKWIAVTVQVEEETEYSHPPFIYLQA